MTDQADTTPATPCWAIVKFELLDPATEQQFHDWYNNAHLPDLVRGDGIVHGWRTKETTDSSNVGAAEQPFWANYHMDTSERFRRRPRPAPAEGAEAPPTPPRPPMDMSGLRLTTNMGQVFYDLLAALEHGDAGGRYFVREEFDVDGSEEARQAFEEYCREEYLSEALRANGVHRAWQLKFLPTDLQLGDDPAATYLNVYEVDDPSSLPARDISGAAKASGSGANADQKGFHVADLLFEAAHDDLV